LVGLGEQDAVELVAAAWPGADVALGKRLWKHTAGNARFLQTILHEHTLDEARDAEDLPAPRELIRTLAARLERLDVDGAALLRAVVILGDQWTASATVAALAGFDDSAVASHAARRLVAQDLVVCRPRRDRSEIRPVSGVLRAAIAETMSPAIQRELHERAATVVDSPVEALRHRFLATKGYDEELATELEAAAWRAHLARHFRQASRIGLWSSITTEDPVARERRLLDALFDATLARDFDAVERQLNEITYAHDEVRRKLVEGFVLSGRRRRSQAAVVVQSIPESEIETADRRTQCRLYILRGWLRLITGGSGHKARRDLSLARAQLPAEPCLSGYFGFACALIDDAGVTGPLVDVPGGVEYQDAWRGAAAAIEGLPDVAVRHLKPFTDRIESGLVVMGDGDFHALLGYAQWLRGDWADARAAIRASLEVRHGRTNPMVRAVAVLADLGRADSTTLMKHRATARAGLREAPWSVAISASATVDFLCLRLTGQHTEQAHYLNGFTADFGTLTWYGSAPALWVLTLGLSNAAAGQAEQVRDLAAQLDDSPTPADWRPAGVAWLRGLGAQLDGDLHAAARWLSDASAHGMTQLPIHASLLCSDLANIRHALGDQPGATSARRDAVQWLARIDGARELMGQATDPLTPLSGREREVAALLTQGLSYAQIAKELYLSRSTVAFHLSKIYAKTGTSSRHELIELVRRG
jgi:DNA-binding CsgD family transcriptional regulator